MVSKGSFPLDNCRLASREICNNSACTLVQWCRHSWKTNQTTLFLCHSAAKPVINSQTWTKIRHFYVTSKLICLRISHLLQIMTVKVGNYSAKAKQCIEKLFVHETISQSKNSLDEKMYYTSMTICWLVKNWCTKVWKYNAKPSLKIWTKIA